MFVNVAGGVQVDEPAADLAIALAHRGAQRGVPTGRLVAFGELGLTGRLRAGRRPSGGSRSARSSGSTPSSRRPERWLEASPAKAVTPGWKTAAPPAPLVRLAKSRSRPQTRCGQGDPGGG